MITSTIHYHGTVDKGYTLLCLDPWTKCFIKADGSVRLCCYETTVGNINEDKLENILNNQNTIDHRRGLLTGDLMPMCKLCGYKKIVPIEDLKQAVEEWYKSGKLPLH